MFVHFIYCLELINKTVVPVNGHYGEEQENMKQKQI